MLIDLAADSRASDTTRSTANQATKNRPRYAAEQNAGRPSNGT